MEERSDTVAEVALRSWHLGASWKSLLEEAVPALFSDLSSASDWARLAMVLGDTRAPGLCFLVCQFARRLASTDVVASRLAAHQALAAWDLGLGAPSPSGTVTPAAGVVESWLARELVPFAGDLERAAVFCLCLSALRVELIRGPSNPTLAQLTDRQNWTLVSQA